MDEETSAEVAAMLREISAAIVTLETITSRLLAEIALDRPGVRARVCAPISGEQASTALGVEVNHRLQRLASG